MINRVTFPRRISRYWQTSLEDYYFFALHRTLGYLFFALITGLFTFAALKTNELFSPFSHTPLSVVILYAWETALNFGLCLYMMDEWISRIWKGWGDFGNRTVLKVWLIWFAAFCLALTIQYLVISQTFEIYDPKMRWAYSVYPQDRPSDLLGFIYGFPFWLVSVFIIIQIAIKKQSILENEKFHLEDPNSRREWVFKQNSDQSKPTHISKISDIEEKQNKTRLVIPIRDTFERIDVEKISHINVEDHYCRIFVNESDGVKEYYIKITLKEILDQLPGDRFLQIHRSHVINLTHASRLIRDSRSYQLVLGQGTYTLPISRYRLPEVLSKLAEPNV